LENQEI